MRLVDILAVVLLVVAIYQYFEEPIEKKISEIRRSYRETSKNYGWVTEKLKKEYDELEKKK